MGQWAVSSKGRLCLFSPCFSGILTWCSEYASCECAYMSVLSLGYAPRKPEQSQPWEQTNEDGGPEHSTMKPSCCWCHQTIGITLTEVTPGLASRPCPLALPAFLGREPQSLQDCIYCSLFPNYWLWTANKTQESRGEQLARGADPHHGRLQYGTRESVPTPES